MMRLDLSLERLRERYVREDLTPLQLWTEIDTCCTQHLEDNIWIHRLTREEIEPYLARLAASDRAALPLYGVPFAIKDNIDLAGIPTTAACAEFAYVPKSSAYVVERLLAAGALPIGKTNLDQFATGLNGTRSPYGAVRNAFNPDYISGGSSSGSAVACAHGLVSFALGPDTAGSGRVPAALNNLIGLKPTLGRLSTGGVVPACRSLDAVSIFALNTQDVRAVFSIADDYDAADIYARRAAVCAPASRAIFRFGVPRQLAFFGDLAAPVLFAAIIQQLEHLGGEKVEIDFEPFLAAARLLYDGPWVAERYLAIESLLKTQLAAVHPIVRAIIEPAAQRTATEAFSAQYALRGLKRTTDACLADLDFILTPTIGTAPTIAALLADPIRLNSQLGHYTKFMNLLDYAAVAVPMGIGANRVPLGATLFGPSHSDSALLDYAARLMGEPNWDATSTALAANAGTFKIVVCGAHMAGLALNTQLTARGATLIKEASTAPTYRLYALAGGPPYRPGLVRVEQAGASIAVEVWALPHSQVGDFLRLVPSPLAIGTIELADGERAHGFLCEAAGLTGAHDITAYGGWRKYLGAIR